jgi:hypothetical protein
MKGHIDEERSTGSRLDPWRIWKLLFSGLCAKLCRRTTHKAKYGRRSREAKLARPASEQGRNRFHCDFECEVPCGLLCSEKSQTIGTTQDGALIRIANPACSQRAKRWEITGFGLKASLCAQKLAIKPRAY